MKKAHNYPRIGVTPQDAEYPFCMDEELNSGAFILCPALIEIG